MDSLKDTTAVATRTPATTHQNASANHSDPSLGDLRNLPLEVRQRIYHYYFQTEGYFYLDERRIAADESFDREDGEKINLSILHVNRWINKEATKALYDTITVAVTAADLFNLRPEYIDLGRSDFNIWKFDPTKGVGDPNKTGDERYLDVGGKILEGLMHPHHFAKFKNVCLDLRVDLCGMWAVKHLPHTSLWAEIYNIDFDAIMDGEVYAHEYEDAKAQVDEASKVALQDQLKRTQLFKLVKLLLANSKIIHRLHIKLGIFGLLEFDERHDIQDLDDDMMAFLNAIGDIRHLEALMDTDLLDPLATVDNVRQATITFHTDFHLEYEAWEMIEKKYLEMARVLEAKIADNFKIKRSNH